MRDRYVFKLADTVVGLHDMRQAQKDLVALRCRFPDTFLQNWSSVEFSEKWLQTITKLERPDTPLSRDQNSIIFLASVRQLWKLSVYVEGQGTGSTAQLEKMALKDMSCPPVSFGKTGEMRESFRKWLKVEVFLRSRYAPSGMESQSEWREKRLVAINQLIESLDKQIGHENFW